MGLRRACWLLRAEPLSKEISMFNLFKPFLLASFAMAVKFVRTALTPFTPKGPYPGVVNAGDLAFTFVAADIVNLNQFLGPGKFLIIAQNTDAAGQTVTLTSKADGLGRTGDVTAYAMATTTVAALLVDTLGWLQSVGNFYLQASSVNVKFAIVKLPY
jgi:hypothetical protein